MACRSRLPTIGGLPSSSSLRTSSRIVPLLMSAYGLTEREQQLTRLVLQGFSTIDIADHLVVSVYTAGAPEEHIRQNWRTHPT